MSETKTQVDSASNNSAIAAKMKVELPKNVKKGYDGDWSWESLGTDVGLDRAQSKVFGKLMRGAYRNDRRTWAEFDWDAALESVTEVAQFSVTLAACQSKTEVK